MKYLFIIIAILVLLLCGSGYYISHQKNKIEDRDAQIGYLQSDFKKTDSVGRSFKDESNLWHNEVATLKVTNLSLKQLNKDKDQQIVKLRTLFPKIKANFRNLDSYTSIKTVNKSKVSGGLKVDSVLDATDDFLPDSIQPIYEGQALSEWDAYTLKVYGGGSCKLDSFQITRSGKESFDQVMYWTRKWFLGKKRYTTETVSLNPSTEIILQNSLVVKKR